MNLNGLRNLLTILFCAGEGLHAYFPVIPQGVSASLAMIIRAAMDEFWPATGFTKDWKNSLRNYLSIIFASADTIHSFLPIVPLGVGTILSLVVRAVGDQIFPVKIPAPPDAGK